MIYPQLLMDKYHIYEEIGKGVSSQVFKGREKKKIEYVAIKRVDKTMMNKIVNEVQIMHRLESQNTLRFYDWYETRNNLWLILEYCTGADLESLLKQDHHLPETSVRSFSLDILTGLKHMHSLGLLHCDIRPRNVLINEFGILKISDFKLARKVPTAPLGDVPISERGGNPSYMSPELFSSDGVHSYSSDLWSFGCILYELRKGFQPFVGNSDTSTTSGVIPVEINLLIENIRCIDPISKPMDKSSSVVLSPELSDLLHWLFEKVPIFRCEWSDVLSHPFWSREISLDIVGIFPPQPAYEAMIQSLNEKMKSSNQESILNQSTMQISINSTNVIDDSAVYDKNRRSHSSLQSAMKNQEVGEESIGGGTSQPTVGTAAPMTPITTRRDSERRKDTPDNSKRTPVTKTPTRPDGTKAVITDATEVVTRTDRVQQQLHPQLWMKMISIESLIIDESDLQVKPIVGNRAIEIVERAPFKASLLPTTAITVEATSRMNQSELQSHLTILYRTLSKAAGFNPSTATNPQGTTSASVSSNVSTAALEQRNNCLAYLGTLASSAEVSNIVLNTNFLYLILKLMKPSGSGSTVSGSTGRAGSSNSKASSILSTRALATSVLAVMLRYATFIHPPTTKNKDDHIIPVLVAVLKDAQEHEQSQELGSDGTAATSLREVFIMPDSAVSSLVRALKDDSDEVVRHYAAKAIENILAQGSLEHRAKFVTVEVAMRLMELSQTSRNESMQATCGIALSHLITLVLASNILTIGNSTTSPIALPSSPATSTAKSNASSLSNRSRNTSNVQGGTPSPAANTPVNPSSSVLNSGRFISRILEKSSLNVITDIIRDGHIRLQQAYLCILCLIFAGPVAFDEILTENTPSSLHITSRIPSNTSGHTSSNNGTNSNLDDIDNCLRSHRQSLCKSVSLLPCLVRLVEQGGSDIIRAKAIIAAQLMCTFQPSLLVLLGEKRLPIVLARLLDQLPKATSGAAVVGINDYTSNKSQPQSMQPLKMTYLDQSIISMIYFIKFKLLEGLQQLAVELRQMQTLIEEDLNSSQSPRSTTVASTTTSSAAAIPTTCSTPNRGYGSRQRAGSSAGLTPRTGGTGTRQSDGEDNISLVGPSGACGDSSVSSTAVVVKACLSLITAPAIRRHVLETGIISALAVSLGQLCGTREILERPQQSGTPRAAGTAVGDRHIGVEVREEALFMCLEAVSQLDIHEYVGDLPVSVTERAGGAVSLLETLTTRLVPAAAALLSHSDDSVRILIASAIRRIVPPLIAATVDITSSVLPVGISVCLESFLVQVPKVLTDVPPVPQYGIRLLADICILGNPIAVKVCSHLCHGPGLATLVQLLRDTVRVIDGEEEEVDLDPQLAVLLRVALDRPDCQAIALEAGVVEAIVTVMKACIVVNDQDISVAVSLLDLLHVLLHHASKAITMNSGASTSSTQKDDTSSGSRSRSRPYVLTDMPTSTLKSFLQPLVQLVPYLLMLMVDSVHIDSTTVATTNQAFTTGSGPNIGPSPSSLATMTMDASIVCMTLMFDLFPDAVVSQFLPNSAKDSGSSTIPASVAQLIANIQIDWKVKFRLLRLLGGFSKIANSSSHLANQTKDFLSNHILRSAVSSCSKTDLREVEDVTKQSCVTFAKQLEAVLLSFISVSGGSSTPIHK